MRIGWIKLPDWRPTRTLLAAAMTWWLGGIAFSLIGYQIEFALLDAYQIRPHSVYMVTETYIVMQKLQYGFVPSVLVTLIFGWPVFKVFKGRGWLSMKTAPWLGISGAMFYYVVFWLVSRLVLILIQTPSFEPILFVLDTTPRGYGGADLWLLSVFDLVFVALLGTSCAFAALFARGSDKD